MISTNGHVTIKLISLINNLSLSIDFLICCRFHKWVTSIHTAPEYRIVQEKNLLPQPHKFIYVKLNTMHSFEFISLITCQHSLEMMYLYFLWLVYVDLITHKYSEYDLWLPYAYLAWGWNILNFSFVVITISVNKSWFQNEWLYKSLKAVDQKHYSWTCNTDILQWWHHLGLHQCSFHCNLAN